MISQYVTHFSIYHECCSNFISLVYMNTVTSLSTQSNSKIFELADYNWVEVDDIEKKALDKKRPFRIFNNIKDFKCYDEDSCKNLQQTFAYLEKDCYDAFNIDPYKQGPSSCMRIYEKRRTATKRMNCLSNKYGGKKSKTKKSKTKKNKTKKHKK